MEIKYTIPATGDQGPCVIVGKASAMESASDNALWAYNSMRRHDGQLALQKLPSGTVAELMPTN